MCSIPIYIDQFDGLCLKERKEGIGRTQKQTGRNTSLDLDNTEDLSIQNESVSKMNEL